MNENELFQKTKKLYQAGNIDSATALAKQRNTKPIRDARVHLQWADLLESLEMIDDMILEMNLAIRDDPANEKTYLQLSEVLSDQGQFDRAARCLYALIKKHPDQPAYYKNLGQIFEDGSEYDKALSTYHVGYERTQDPDFQSLIRALDFVRAEQSEDEPVEYREQIVPSKHHLVTFTTLFSGREGVYARQWHSPTGETGYTPIHEPFTIKVAENHILGNHTIGIYPVRLDNTANFLAFDLDMPKFILNKVITRESLWKQAIQKVHTVACSLIDVAASLNVPVYLEDSGFKGRHVWIFLDTPVPAGVAKKFGEMILEQLKDQTPEVSIEVFPKQGTVRGGGLGNLIKVPLGIHKKTSNRGVFMHPDGTRPASQLEFLENISKVSRNTVFSLIQKLQASTSRSVKPVSPPLETPPLDDEPIEKGLTPMPKPATVPFDPNRDEQYQYLLLKCPVIKHIVEKIQRESMIGKQETQVILYTLGHLDNGPQIVNALFDQCINADPKMYLKTKFSGNPVSCPKIRYRVPYITSVEDCNCQFDPSINLYPTPLIHVYSRSHRHENIREVAVNSIQFQNLLHEYLRLRAQLQEIALSLSNHETKLNEFFEHAGLDDVQTPIGTLRRIKNDQQVSFLLELPGIKG